MTKRELKPEYQEGGSKRFEILEKAVRYLQDKRIMQTQADRQHFLINELGLSTSEYMEVLNKASGGALMESVWN
jgi:hypothetical protein